MKRSRNAENQDALVFMIQDSQPTGDMMRDRQLLHLRAGMMGVLVAFAAMLTPRAAWSQAGGGNPAPHVEAKVTKLQWRRPIDQDYQDVSDTLTVLKGTRVIFKAIKDDPNKPWSSGKPEWSGSSGVSGTGETKDVTFDTLSASTSDYKTVTAKGDDNSSATANVIVYELTPDTRLKDEDNFAGRSQSRFGVYETVNLIYTTNPTGITPDIEWRRYSGITDIFADLWVVGGTGGEISVRAWIVSGPSRDEYRTLTRTAVEPTGVVFQQIPNTTVFHKRGHPSVGILLEGYLRPTDVSFRGIVIAEGKDPGKGTGDYKDGEKPHPASLGWSIVGAGNIILGAFALQDTASLGETVDVPVPKQNTTYTWSIPYVYANGQYADLGSGKKFTTVTQLFTISRTGTASVSKGGVSATKALGEDSSGYNYNR